MLRKLLGVFLVIIILLLPVTVLSSCSSNNTTPSDLPEPGYAGDITENILVAINNDDYAKFSQDFDTTMKNAINQQSFEQQIITGVKGKIGDYVANSKKFLQAASVAGGDAVVVYQAQYTTESASVAITISFKDINGKPMVDGLYFNSPKLRGG